MTRIENDLYKSKKETENWYDESPVSVRDLNVKCWNYVVEYLYGTEIFSNLKVISNVQKVTNIKLLQEHPYTFPHNSLINILRHRLYHSLSPLPFFFLNHFEGMLPTPWPFALNITVYIS